MRIHKIHGRALGALGWGLSLILVTGPVRAAEDPGRFNDVPEWRGFLRVRGSGSGPVPNVPDSSYQVTLSADLPLLLKGVPGAPLQVTWSGCITSPTAELHSHLSITCQGGVTESTVTASAPFSDLGVGSCPGASLTIFPPPLGEGTAEAQIPELAFSATEHLTSDCPDTNETFEEIPVALLPGAAQEAFLNVPLPDEGLLIQASWTLEQLHFLTGLGAYGNVTWEIDLQLSGEAQDLELVVVFDDEDHATWLPQADFEERTEGNSIRFHAELRKKDGSPTTRRAVRFICELPEVSTEPGVCLNWPPANIALRTPDLQFLPSRNPSPWLPRNGRDLTRIETEDGEYARSPVATLSCFDWGAFASLKVLAVLPGGETLEGHLEGDSAMTSIPIPKRAPGSRIADAWKQQQPGASGKNDGADDETRPAGDGHPGDGFTLYEEYRGFYTSEPRPEAHVEGDPGRKDLFIRDGTGSGGALSRFARLTGLRARGDLAEPLLDEQRVVNFNGVGSPNHADQHALVLERSGLAADIGGQAVGGPGLPKSVTRIMINEDLDPAALSSVVRSGVVRSRSRFISTVVHELLHGCNVYHHGQGDVDQNIWLVTEAPDGSQTITEGGRTIEVYLENGLKVTFGSAGARQVYLGVKGGQHSGPEDCVMRYDVATAHTANGSAVLRYIGFDELVGYGLCSGNAGTGVNGSRPFGRPNRYGDASAGCCGTQVCISDRQTHAARAGATACGGSGGALDGESGGGGGIAPEATPGLSLAGNGRTQLTVFPGDPVLLLAQIFLEADSPPGSSLGIVAPGERWTRWLRIEVTSEGGGAAAWPTHLATEGEQELLITEETGGVAGWWTRPEETAALAPGVYEARVRLDASAAPRGWQGSLSSRPVRLVVAPLPDPVPVDLAMERELRLAQYHLVAADLGAASSVIERILALDPRSPAGLTLRGALRSAEGDPVAALEAYEEAIASHHEAVPDPEEPPGELLRLEREALAKSGLLTVEGEARFRRGDPNLDGLVDIADAIAILFHLFRGSPAELVCAKNADVDDSGRLDLTDAVAILGYLFLGRAPPPAPFGECGHDPTPDNLECSGVPLCP